MPPSSPSPPPCSYMPVTLLVALRAVRVVLLPPIVRVVVAMRMAVGMTVAAAAVVTPSCPCLRLSHFLANPAVRVRLLVTVGVRVLVLMRVSITSDLCCWRGCSCGCGG